jgi:DNA-binding FadR family transcriptional regulator
MNSREEVLLLPLSSTIRTSLVPQVIAQLRSQIASGEWAVGTRIPPEPALAAALGVGRNTLREAVLALVHAGLLERRQGSGTYVVGSRELSGAVARRLADADLADIIEVRRAFEVQAARSAAYRRTETDLALLDAALAAREAARDAADLAAFVEADVRLHQAIVAAAHNRVLADLHADVSAALRGLVHSPGPDLTPGRYVDHARLVAAIHAGDPDRAATEAALSVEAPEPAPTTDRAERGEAGGVAGV